MLSDPIEYELGVPIPGVILPEAQWVKTGIKRLPETGPLDWASIFGRVAPVVLDLGCGNGRYTLLSALARPEYDHFATDILPVVIRYATRRGNQRGLSNTRFAVKDAETFMRHYVPGESVAEVHLYHPQPFHDSRFAHKRVVTPRLLADVMQSLRTGGLFVVQTDNPDYWRYMTKVLPEFFQFHEQDGPWPDAPEGRSRREILARGRGLRIYRGFGVKRDDVDAEAVERLVRDLPMPTFRSRGPWNELDRLDVDTK